MKQETRDWLMALIVGGPIGVLGHFAIAHAWARPWWLVSLLVGMLVWGLYQRSLAD